LEITVEDSGIGIQQDFLPFVFDRFRQADSSTARRHGGLGIGLSIVKHLVELHGGSVRVKSRGPNQGSTFIVALPIVHVSDEHRPTERRDTHDDPLATVDLPRLDGVKVLIVDDESDGQALVARVLADRGARCACASDVDEAMGRLAAERFEIVLSDIGMPGKDGYELMRQMRARESEIGGPIPAIAITAYARPQDRERSFLAGFQMHLSKPIESRELIAAIASMLRVSR
jgi:CheY-like chemotaxis protein